MGVGALKEPAKVVVLLFQASDLVLEQLDVFLAPLSEATSAFTVGDALGIAPELGLLGVLPAWVFKVEGFDVLPVLKLAVGVRTGIAHAIHLCLALGCEGPKVGVVATAIGIVAAAVAVVFAAAVCMVQ